MVDGYHEERKLILNTNDQRLISSGRFMVNTKTHKNESQNAFIGKVTINIRRVVMLLFDKVSSQFIP